MEATMHVVLVPVLWVAGTAILLGGGFYVLGHIVH
jgi:hypothetical protein